jgi:hypothetical protein
MVATMDAMFLDECYRVDAERPKDMSPDMVSFMIEADELADAFVQESGGGPPPESIHDRLARMRREQGEDDDDPDAVT